MRLYLVLLPFFFLSQNNLWSWQSSSTMTKQEIEAQLALKNQALEALLKKYNLSIKTALSAEQLAILKKAHAILGIAEAPQDIGKKTFVEYVQDWVQDFIKILDEEKRTDLQINVPSIITSLREQIKKPNFPISMLLWKTLKREINKLSSPTTAEGLREALLKGFHAFKTEMGTKFQLTQHFKKNRASYQKIKKKNLNELVMTASDFETWLKGLLKEQRELEKEQRELEKEQQELENSFKIAYRAWLANQRMQIKDLISKDKGTDSTHNMSKAKFIAILLDQSKEWEREQPELGQEIKERIVLGLKGDSLSIKDYVNAMNSAYTNIVTSEATIAKRWYDRRGFFDIAGLLTALITENSGTSKYDVVEEYIQWFSKVGGVVDNLKLPASRQFIASKLMTGFEGLLTSNELNIFLPELSRNIKAHNKSFLSLEETSRLWRNSIGALIKSPDKLPPLENDESFDSTSLDSLDQRLLGTAGPSTLQQLFKQALRPLPKPTALSKGEFINLLIYLNDGSVLTNKLMTTLDRVNRIPFAYPSSIQLDVSKGKSPYEFEVKSIFDQSPVVRNKQMVTVDFEYTIAFSKDRGSSEIGGERIVEHVETKDVAVQVEQGNTVGTEKTNSRGRNHALNLSHTMGGGAEAEGSFLGLFGGSVSAHREVTIGGQTEWTSEQSHTDINISTNSVSVQVGSSSSTGVSNNDKWNATVQHGQEEGYLTVKGVLTTSDIEEATMLLSIEEVSFSSPNMKGLAITQIDAKKGKTVRWKK